MRQIRNSEKQLLLLLVGRGRLLVQQRNLIANFPHPRLEFFRRFAARAFPANLLAQSFPVGVQLLQRRFRFAPFRVHAQHFIDPGDILVGPASSEPALHKIGLFADEPDVEHALEYQRHGGSANSRL